MALNTGMCIGGPWGDKLIASPMNQFDVSGSLYRWCSFLKVGSSVELSDGSIAKIASVDVETSKGDLVTTDGYWLWEHHQERDDLPADRN